ncbi:hypothetical protein CPB84DRAFT_1970400 [Gymnopilus junonius]|uniref:PIN-like protein n=1 Tax=Gymnopilus junonius TaxID=109634 RepID=A0A9P5N6D0_GYMJU|nr:hypothetical protein CPB84DRAFT_1970400 [Gymnopilus junonius]
MVDIQRVFSFAAGSAPVSAIGSTALGSESPFVKLLLAVFNSILEVFLLCAAGYILARHGILDKRTQKQINRLNVSLFTPALLFSKVAFFLTPEKLRELWIVPVFFTIVTLASIGMCLLPSISCLAFPSMPFFPSVPALPQHTPVQLQRVDLIPFNSLH